tara:strand:+ start:76 stop:333 length:258 start_codon:yes stop_codon:yes gene_type:complete
MQKIINVLAITSFVISGAVVGGGFYLYSQKDAIIEDIKEKALGSLGGLGNGLGGDLPIGTPDLAPPAGTGQAAVPPVGSGFGIPN